MRSKRFLAAVALAIAGLFVVAPTAFAQEDDHSDETTDEMTEEDHGEGADPHAVFEEAEHILYEADAHHADIECVEIILVELGSVEDCRDAPNPLVPETNELIWGGFGFLVVLAFLAKFGLPAIKGMMDERAEKIQADLDAAEQAKADAEAVKADYAAKVADAKTEAARIIEEARQAADQLRSDQQARLNDELATARAAAQADIDAAKGQAMAELRGEVAEIAIGAAGQVVESSLDRDAQIRLIEDYINRVSNS